MVLLLLLLLVRRRTSVALLLIACSSESDATGGPDCEVPATPYRLANLSACPAVIALDETHVYWIDDGQRLMRFPKCGSSSPPDVLLAPVASYDLAVGAQAVYVTDSTRVFGVSKTGEGMSVLATLSAIPEELWIDGDDLYATTQAGVCVVGEPCPAEGTLISRIAVNDGAVTPVLVYEGGQIFDLTGGGGWLYFTGSLLNLASGLNRVPETGGPIAPLLPEDEGVSSTALAVSDGFVFFSNLNALRRAPIDGGASSVVTNLDAEIGSLAADSSHVYFTTGWGTDGALARVPLSGADATTLVTGTDPASVVVDDGAVYYATCQNGDDAALWIMAK